MRRQLTSLVFRSTRIFLGLAVFSSGSLAIAETFTVDSTADAVDAAQGDGRCATAAGGCTLRAAIQEANALQGTDAIDLPAGTYTLARAGGGEDHAASGDLDITSSLGITGAGAASTIIDGDLLDRVFEVTSTGAAVIIGVTVRHGEASSGGGVQVDGGTLMLVESAISGNAASDLGGGIANHLGILTLVRTTVSGNVAHNSGGGIDNSGTATVSNGTVSGNTADLIGGGISNVGTVTLNNSTVTANTMTGIDNDGQVVSMNTLLAANVGPDCQGTLTSQGFNLIHDPTGCTIEGDTPGNLIGMDASLSPLQDNGGPTFTHALLPGSAAIDAGDPAAPGSGGNACEARDQRGVVRPQGPRCDIGAFESSLCGNGAIDPGEQCDDGDLTEGDGCSSTCQFESPDAPPDCSSASADPGGIWPPNHKFVPVAIEGVTDPDGDAVRITITGIAQDEPLFGPGEDGAAGQPDDDPGEDDGEEEAGAATCPDGAGVGTDTASVRAERSGNGDGRVYRITFRADDGRGGQCTGTVEACVPHDQGRSPACGDQGPQVDSTGPTCPFVCYAGEFCEDNDCDPATRFLSVSCVLETPICSGEPVPGGVTQRFHEVRKVLERAARAQNPRRAQRLVAKAVRSLGKAAGIAAGAVRKGSLSPQCAAELQDALNEARRRTQSWLVSF